MRIRSALDRGRFGGRCRPKWGGQWRRSEAGNGCGFLMAEGRAELRPAELHPAGLCGAGLCGIAPAKPRDQQIVEDHTGAHVPVGSV